MSLLFKSSCSVETFFSVKQPAELAGVDTALISRKLWDSLSTPETVGDTLAISITSVDNPSSGSHYLRNLSGWAKLNEETVDFAIPPSWLTAYSHIFEIPAYSPSLPRKVTITRLQHHIPLDEVIVTALSREAYIAAQRTGSLLEEQLSAGQVLLRQGDIHTVDTESFVLDGHVVTETRSFHYRLDMTSPVLQGYAQTGTTRFVVVSNEPTDISHELPESLSVHGGDFEMDPDGIVIDESFLASSILPAIRSPPSSSSVHNSESRTSGFEHATTNSVSPLRTASIEFRIKALSTPLHADDDSLVYLRTADLGKIGVQSGDWAVASICNSTNYRLIRLLANDRLVLTTGVIAASPTLLHNLCMSSSPLAPRLISIRASPFGSYQPAIPTAQTVTIARVASPVSVDRVYQPLFLNSLKSYFDGRKRLVKLGDLIAVGIDTDTLRRSQDMDHKSNDTVNFDSPDHPASLSHFNEIAFFVVTNIEHGILSNVAIPSSQDMYAGSTVGELGCWVDSTVTRMVQTGVEHSRVPDVGAYMGTDTSRALVQEQSFQHLQYMQNSNKPFAIILSLVAAVSVPHAVDYNLQLSLLLKGARGSGKFTVASWVARYLGMHVLEVNCYDVVGETDIKTEATIRAYFDKAATCSPCVLVLRHIDALIQTTQGLEAGKEPVLTNVLRGCMNDLQQSWKITGFPAVVFGTTSDPSRLPIGLTSCFKHEITFEAPGEAERSEILQSLLKDTALAPDVSTTTLAIQTAALVASDLVDLVTRARSSAAQRVQSITNLSESDLTLAGISLSAADFDGAIAKARASYSESIGAPKIPNVSWDDVGGLSHVKSDILDTIQLPLDHPELFSDGLKKRSGILLYGPPGTGKTLLAKAVATSCSLNFFSIKGPELLNMYIGESEANVRRVFQRARDAKPCVIFFDELDSVAPKRGNHGDSGGVMDRIVSQLLAELDGMSGGKGGADVFVIGATNRPDLLDPALLRPGRFDRMLYLGVSDSHSAQLNILKALTRKFRLHPSLRLNDLADKCPLNYTGADFYALCSDAMLNAMTRKAEELELTIARLNDLPGPYTHPHPLTPQYFLAEIASASDLEVLITTHDFDCALRDLVPSVSQSEMDHYASIQKRFSRDVIDTDE